MVIMNVVVQTRHGQYDVFPFTFALYASLGQVIWNSLSHLKKAYGITQVNYGHDIANAKKQTSYL